MLGKASYLKKLTEKMRFRSVAVEKKISGTSPPSLFIGSYGYPKVFIGPMVTPAYGDTSILDMPEAWIPKACTTDDIIRFRLQLVRGKETARITDLDNKTVLKIQEIALSGNSVDSDVEFKNKPKGITFNEEHQPFGPSAELKKFDVGNIKWNQHLESVFYDVDLGAGVAVLDLYKKGIEFTQIQKAFSAGTMGLRKNRKLVPTRWSITAVDDTLGKHLVEDIKNYETVDKYEVYEFEVLKNYFAILFIPSLWRYEFLEAFIHVIGNEEVIFSDWEEFRGRRDYASIGGCYYSVRFAAAEKLAFRKRQASVIVFREAYEGYVPLGVFTCRETARHAMMQRPKEFDDLKSSLNHITRRLRLPMARFIKQSSLLKDVLQHRQMRISEF